MPLSVPFKTSDRVPLQSVRDWLRVGEPLPFRILDAQDRLLLNEGQMLIDTAQFDALVERGAWAERALVEAARATRQRGKTTRPNPISLFDRWEKILWQFDKLTRALIRGQAEGSVVPDFLDSIRALVTRDPDVALFLCVRQDDRRFALYALTHSLHCAVVALLAGRQLGWTEGKVASMACAALTMNLTIFDLQAEMAEQADPPTKKQVEQIRSHPNASAQLLQKARVSDSGWLSAVTEHHEHIGGGGYPSGVVEVTDSAQVIRVVDVLMAKISARAGRPAMLPQMAVRQLFLERQGDALAMGVIKAFGINPPGSLVRLRNGETGVAIRRLGDTPHPIVATLSDSKGRPIATTHHRDTSLQEFSIQGPSNDAKSFPRVVPERVYGWIEA
jgi:hypothetical protein